MTEPRAERPLGELFGDLAEQLGRLIRQEAELARTEMAANVTRLARDASLVGAGGVLAHAGMLALVAAVIALLASLGLPVWMSATLVGLILLAAGIGLAERGRTDLRAASLAPTRTIESIQEDVEWARSQAK